MYSEDRIKQVREADSMGLGHKPEARAVTIKPPRPACFDDLESRLVVPVEKLIGDAYCRIFVGEFQGFRAKPLDAGHGDETVWQNAAHCSFGLEVFKSCHERSN